MALPQFYQLDPVLDTSLLNDEMRNPNSNYGRQVFSLFMQDVIVLDLVVRQDASQHQLLHLTQCMRNGASIEAYDHEYTSSRELGNLCLVERNRFTYPGQGTMCCYPTWEEAWDRNVAILTMLNEGYALPVELRTAITPPSGEVDAAPVYRVRCTNDGKCAQKAGAALFMGMPASVYLCRGLQVRLPVNLWGEIGQSWGLVNGAIGTVVEVIYPTAESVRDERALPTVVVHFDEYRGPAFCTAATGLQWERLGPSPPSPHEDIQMLSLPAVSAQLLQLAGSPVELTAPLTWSVAAELRDANVRTFHCVKAGRDYFRPLPSRPKLVVIPPIERQGECSCKCKRRCLPFRVAEGTTVDSTQGITVGAKHMVKRLGIGMGDASVEQRRPGLSLVANSRAETTEDFCYVKPVELSRLAVCGVGSHANKLKAKMDYFSAHQSHDAQVRLPALRTEPHAKTNCSALCFDVLALAAIV